MPKGIVAELKHLARADYSLPSSLDDILIRINQFTKYYQSLIFTIIIISFISLVFIYQPFVWVVSLTPLPFVIHQVLLTKKYGMQHVMSEIEENEVILICGMVCGYISFLVNGLYLLLYSAAIPGVIILVIGMLHK
ncbi:PRA1 family protein [Entamoeba marina]